MSGAPHMQGDDGTCGQAPLYVLGLLDELEAERFASHAQTCVVCRDEVVALAPAVDALGESVPHMRVPRKLRRRVMTAVHAEASVSETLAGKSRRRSSSLLRLPRLQPAALLASCCALLVAGVLGAVLFSSGAPGTRTFDAQVSYPNATAALHRSGSHMWLTVDHMPSPGKGRVYEVWVQRGRGAPTPTSGLFSPTSNGAGAVAITGDLTGVSEVLVTSEPEGGTLKPTRSPVIVGRIS